LWLVSLKIQRNRQKVAPGLERCYCFEIFEEKMLLPTTQLPRVEPYIPPPSTTKSTRCSPKCFCSKLWPKKFSSKFPCTLQRLAKDYIAK